MQIIHQLWIVWCGVDFWQRPTLTSDVSWMTWMMAKNWQLGQLMARIFGIIGSVAVNRNWMQCLGAKLLDQGLRPIRMRWNSQYLASTAQSYDWSDLVWSGLVVQVQLTACKDAVNRSLEFLTVWMLIDYSPVVQVRTVRGRRKMPLQRWKSAKDRSKQSSHGTQGTRRRRPKKN